MNPLKIISPRLFDGRFVWNNGQKYRGLEIPSVCFNNGALNTNEVPSPAAPAPFTPPLAEIFSVPNPYPAGRLEASGKSTPGMVNVWLPANGNTSSGDARG